MANGSCRTEFARPKGTVVSIFAKKQWVLRNHDGNKNPTDLHIWQWKTVFLHALHVHFSSFDILKTSSFFLWREMTFFAVVWTTWAYDDKYSILSCPKRWFRFHPRIVKAHFSGIMTLNNWKIEKCEVTFSDDVLASIDVVFAWAPSWNCLTNDQLAPA